MRTIHDRPTTFRWQVLVLWRVKDMKIEVRYAESPMHTEELRNAEDQLAAHVHRHAPEGTTHWSIAAMLLPGDAMAVFHVGFAELPEGIDWTQPYGRHWNRLVKP